MSATSLLKVIGTGVIQNASGVAIQTGTISFVATDANDSPIPFRIGGNVDGSSSFRQALSEPVYGTVTAGSIDGDFYIANPALTSPLNIRYRISITDLQTGRETILRRVVVIGDAGNNWNLGSLNTGLLFSEFPVAPGLTFRGAWQTGTQYNLLDILTYGGTTYTPTIGFVSGSVFDASNLAIIAASGTITPSLLAMLSNAFDYSSENSAVTTIGSSGLADDSYVLPSTTFALPKRLPAGLLSSITTTIGHYTSGATLTVYILNDHGSNSFSVAQSFTVAPSGTGLQTFYAGGDFDPLEVEQGQLLAFYSTGALVGFLSSGTDGLYSLTGQATNTAATYTPGAGDTMDFAAAIRIFVQPTTLAPVLQSRLDNAYGFSQANTQLISVGLTNFGITAYTQPTTAFAIPNPLVAGQLQSLRIAFISAPAGSTLTILILNQTAPATFSVVDSFTIAIGLVSTAQYLDFIAGTDFDARPVQAGQFIGFQSLNGANPGFAAGTQGYFEFLPIGTVPSSTPAAWAQYAGVTLAFQASVLANLSLFSAKDGSKIVSAGRSLLERQTFPGTALPVGWGQSGGWTVGSGAGLISPTSGQGYTCGAYSSNTLNVERRSYIIHFAFLTTGSIFAVYSAMLDAKDENFGSQILVDAVANNLVLDHQMSGSTSNPGVSQTVSLGFVPAVGTLYTLLIRMDRRVMTVSVADPVSGITASIVSGNNNAPNIDEGAGSAAGLMFDSVGFKCIAGQIAVSGYSIYADARYPRALFVGDSITHGAGVKVSQRWAQLVANKAGNCLISGKGGCSSDNALQKCDTELPFIRPDYLVIMIGSNDAFPGNLGLAAWQSNYTSMISKAAALGVKVIGCTIPPRGDIAQSIINPFNTWLLAQTGITIVRMDRALTTSHDGVTQDTSLYQTDTIHPNVAGSIAMAARFAIDAPALLDAAAFAGQFPSVFPDTSTGTLYTLAVTDGEVVAVPV